MWAANSALVAFVFLCCPRAASIKRSLATLPQDVPMIDQTFGFDTACTEAAKAVNSAPPGSRLVTQCVRLCMNLQRSKVDMSEVR